MWMQTLWARPMAQKELRREEPPALRKGRLRPMTGRSLKHMPIFIAAWTTMRDRTPRQRRNPWGFLARLAK